LHFTCSHPYAVEEGDPCVLRIGVIPDYESEYEEKRSIGLRLINTPGDHALISELPNWYPLIADLTPRSVWADAAPAVEEIEATFSWPIFVKGARQTSRHNPDLAIVRDPQHYQRVVAAFRDDRILHWQKIVIRDFVELMPVRGSVPGKIRPSLEFRSFWWFGRCVGVGRYWHPVPPYEAPDLDDGLAVASLASSRLNVPFVVIDFAKTIDGRWIVIECNDAQESGYAAILPQTLWRAVLALVG
jgi:hypothetical protein